MASIYVGRFEGEGSQLTLDDILRKIPTIHSAIVASLCTVALTDIAPDIKGLILVLAAAFALASGVAVWSVRRSLKDFLEDPIGGEDGLTFRGKFLWPSLVTVYFVLGLITACVTISMAVVSFLNAG